MRLIVVFDLTVIHQMHSLYRRCFNELEIDILSYLEKISCEESSDSITIN